MARPWLKVEPALLTHPKTRALARMWKCHPYQVVGFLVALWGYCLEFQADGNVDGRPADVLDELATPCFGQALGTMRTVREALEQVGFVDQDGRLHDWDEYAGALVAKRSKDRRRKRLERRGSFEDVQRTSLPRPVDVTGTSSPRVEQSRVEQSREQQQPPAAGVPTGDYATRCVLAVNRALEQKLAGAYRPLLATVERPAAAAWEAEGIPIDFVEVQVAALTERFRAERGNGRQPNSLAYFSNALREAWATEQARLAGPPLTPAEEAFAVAKRMRAAEGVT